jgi:hypothetical protein
MGVGDAKPDAVSAGDTITDGVTGAAGKGAGGTGVKGEAGGARVEALSSSALDRVRGGGGARAGVPDLLFPFLALDPVEGPAIGCAGVTDGRMATSCFPAADDPLRSLLRGAGGSGAGTGVALTA